MDFRETLGEWSLLQCTPWGPEHVDLASISMDGGGTSHSLTLLDCPGTWPCVFQDPLGQGGMSSPPSSSGRLRGGPSHSFSLSLFLPPSCSLTTSSLLVPIQKQNKN